MGKGHQRDPKREAYWRAVLARQGQSGLSVRAFCERERLAETALYAWRRTIRQRDQEREPARPRNASAAPAFVPLVVHPQQPVQSPAEECIRVELRGGRMMRLPLSMPAGQLAAVVRAIEGHSAMIEEGA
jgi:transposase-like protein